MPVRFRNDRSSPAFSSPPPDRIVPDDPTLRPRFRHEGKRPSLGGEGTAAARLVWGLMRTKRIERSSLCKAGFCRCCRCPRDLALVFSDAMAQAAVDRPGAASTSLFPNFGRPFQSDLVQEGRQETRVGPHYRWCGSSVFGPSSDLKSDHEHREHNQSRCHVREDFGRVLRLLPAPHRLQQQCGSQSNPEQASQLGVLKIADQPARALDCCFRARASWAGPSNACVQPLRGKHATCLLLGILQTPVSFCWHVPCHLHGSIGASGCF